MKFKLYDKYPVDVQNQRHNNISGKNCHNTLQSELYTYLHRYNPHYLYTTCPECDCIRPFYIGHTYVVKKEFIHKNSQQPSSIKNGRKYRYGYTRSDISIHYVSTGSGRKHLPGNVHTVIELVYTHDLSAQTWKNYRKLGVNILRWFVNPSTSIVKENFVMHRTKIHPGKPGIVPRPKGWTNPFLREDSKEHPL